MDFLERTRQLLRKEQMKRLQKANIIIFGCGGVGGYVAEMLIRSGIIKLTVVDFDKITLSNLNRQIIATRDTIGQYKVDALCNRATTINPKIKISPIKIKFSEQNKEEFDLTKFDYIIDAIDSVQDKLLLIKIASIKKIPIISAMGAGNKINIPSFQICDIFKTENDALAKKMRKLLKAENIKKLTVCCSNQKGVISSKVGSIAYYPAMAGCMIASYVINEIIKEK